MADNILNSGGAPDGGPQIGLQKIYMKDASFEAPASPAIFRGEWKPKVTVNLATRTADVGNDGMEVVLEISVEAKQNDSVAYLVEVQQAGIFLMKGFGDEDRQRVLSTFCPTQLYPYAREAVADLVGKGGFPQLQLQPVSFDSMLAAAEAERDAAEARPDGGDSAPA
ncbi:MAG: protein-export chaperone SecB [Chromatiales bacterium]|jgi:preprotein translocase subunit SecB|nr:protein-export chaperone SecB [Chromatiales bacterium]